MDRVVLSVLLPMVFLCGCATKPSSDSSGFVQWASANLIAVAGFETALAELELEAFRGAIGSARVVGIGESRHDTREQLLLKGLLVRHLVEDLGFRVLILEESFPHAEAIDRYVTGGEGELRTLMNGLAGWYLWDTEEMLELVQWVHGFNAGRDPHDQVRIYGMDITAPALGVRSVLDSMRVAGIDSALEARALGLDLQQGDFWPGTWERYGALSDERRSELGRNYVELIETLRTERSSLVASSSESAFERTLLLGEIGSWGNELFSSADRERGGVVRERGMAQTVLWILDREMKGDKAIVWAHNLHVAKSSFRMPGFAEGVLEPMGIQLSEALGEAYVAIGAAFGQGAYSADLPPGERLFEQASEDVVDGALARVGVPRFVIDLRGVDQDPAASRWLRQERVWRAQDSDSVLVPSAAFDLVYFVPEISRSQPTPLALQRYRSSRD